MAIGYEPVIGGLMSPVVFWAMQTDPVNSTGPTSFIDQLPNYGFAGLIVGLVIWGLSYFDKKEDKSEKNHQNELETIRSEMDKLRKELSDERNERRRQEQNYLDQASKLQGEVSDLKIKLALAQNTKSQ